jgi:SAM-dependent methyltransferase
MINMDQRQLAALANIDLSGLGLEIGPSYSPLVPKLGGARVETIDHASREELIAKYREFGLPEEKLAQIDEVDYIWRGGSLVSAIGDKERYDYIVAAHVIEHSVDLIGFLQDCETLLKPHGRVALAVPDKRYCFDFYRPQTSVGAVVDAQGTWTSAQTSPPQTQNADLHWGPTVIKNGDDQETYFDIHRWVYTPASLSLLLEDLAELGYHSLVEIDSAETNGYEFYVTLERGLERRPVASRTERLQRIQRESSDAETPLLRAALAASRAEVAELKASTSWRATAPLRMVSARLQHLRSGRG